MNCAWKCQELLHGLQDGQRVAVVTFFGSLCPITLSHVQGLLESRRILMGEPGVKRPARLETFHAVLGFISLDGDLHVGEIGEMALDLKTRKHLVELAVEEYDWIDVEEWEGASIADLQQQWPQLNFTTFFMDGADDVVKSGKYEFASEQDRCIAICRPGSSERLRQAMAMSCNGINLDDGYFILGPELPDISSTDAKKALAVQHGEALQHLLHPNVIEWFTKFRSGPAISLDCLSPRSLATVIDRILVLSHLPRRTDRRTSLICAFEDASLDEATLLRLGAAAAAKELVAKASKRIPRMAVLETAFEEWLVRIAALNPATTARKMVSQTKGSWRLLGKSGNYTYDETTGDIKTSRGGFVGRFSFKPISEQPLPMSDGKRRFPCIGITDSEIMLEVAKPANHEAFFVLPSQLNGAEYPCHSFIVTEIDDYRYDDTGGPRGQLSVHPAAGQFILDNAACKTRENGINALDQVIAQLNKHGFDFKLVNGYMQVPACEEGETEQALNIIGEAIHTLRPLVMQNVQACGADPSLTSLTNNKHRVNLVYASAVPVDTYLNSAKDRLHLEFTLRVAETVLYAQYYGALKHAAAQGPPTAGGKRMVYMMPLGGGVFRNPTETIVSAMSCAVESLTDAERDTLNIQVLTFHGKHGECREFTRLVEKTGKLKK